MLAHCRPVLVALALSSTSSVAEGPVLSSPPTMEPAAILEISRRVEEIRGLEFKKKVPVRFVGQDAAREYAARRLSKFTSPEGLASEERAYRILGLLPPDTSLEDAYGNAVMEAVAGFYDPEGEELFLLDDLPGAAGPIFAAHELTHALEDQHYDLDARIGRSMHDGDLAFAVMAVHEGSASLVMAIYTEHALAEGRVGAADLEALAASDAGRGEKVAALAPILRRQLLGAYVLGVRFLLRGQSAMAGIRFPGEETDRCYRDGPLSSEQILHPDKFWDPGLRDPPRQVDLKDSARLLDEGWKRTGEGTLGEISLGLLVGAPTPKTWTSSLAVEEWTNTAAAGWGGDRWQLWTRGSDAMVVLATAWDSEVDAREFARALPRRDDSHWRRAGSRVTIVAGQRDSRLARSVLREFR